MFERIYRFPNHVAATVTSSAPVAVWHMFNCSVATFKDQFADEVLGSATDDEFMNLSLTLNLLTNEGTVAVNGVFRGDADGDDIMRIQLAMKAEPVFVGTK